MTNDDSARRDYIDALGKAHGFTFEELVENRAGRLHPKQAARLARVGRGGTVLAIVFASLTLTAGLGGAYLLYDDIGKPLAEISEVDRNSIYLLAGAGVVLSMVFEVGAFLSYRKRMKRRALATQGGVLVAEGPLRKIHIEGRGGVQSQWRIAIDGVTFGLLPPEFELLTHGAHYRAYHLGGELLGIEPG